MLITEALAELKTISKRIAKKQEYVKGYLYRQDGLRDPLEKDGGSQVAIAKELQAIGDLNRRLIDIRVAIQVTNQNTQVVVEGEARSIAEWLTWRKEVSEGEKSFVDAVRRTVLTARAQAQQKGYAVVPEGAKAANPGDLVINVNEAQLAAHAEKLETILGTLDGQLSLKNATVNVIGL